MTESLRDVTQDGNQQVSTEDPCRFGSEVVVIRPDARQPLIKTINNAVTNLLSIAQHRAGLEVRGGMC